MKKLNLTSLVNGAMQISRLVFPKLESQFHLIIHCMMGVGDQPNSGGEVGQLNPLNHLGATQTDRQG